MDVIFLFNYKLIFYFDDAEIQISSSSQILKSVIQQLDENVAI